MAGHRRQTPLTLTRSGSFVVVLSFGVVVAGCSWSRLDDSSTGEMRAVPSVRPTLAPGEEVAVVPPTGPLTTDVIGDPQPEPDSDATLPPLPEGPVVDACVRLGDAAAVEQFGAAVGDGVASAESLGGGACRLVAGSGLAEIHYLSEDVVESDWFRRDAIEPVGDLTADAVGLAVFTAPGSPSEVGYTIALVSRREGAVIAVRGTPDDRAVAVQLAGIVSSTT